MQDDLWMCAAAALSLFKREGLSARRTPLADHARLPLSSRWRLIAAISSGPQPIGDAPTAAMEAEGARKLIEEVRRASSGPGLSIRFNALAPQHYKVVTFFLATMPSQTR